MSIRVAKLSKKGMAMVEALPIIMVMFVFMGATLGSWGIVHTAILNSISARNVTFFYFNNRSDLSYLRDWGEGYNLPSNTIQAKFYYFRKDGTTGLGKRFHYIQSEKYIAGTHDEAYASLRNVNFAPLVDYDSPPNPLRVGQHSDIKNHPVPEGKNQAVTTEKVGDRHKAWVMVGYGICLSAHCGD